MCIAAFVWQANPDYPFLLLLNRDEYHNRPAKAVGWWEDGEILGGRDEVGGGTWLACSRGGKVAFVTNVLELHTDLDAKSRGELPVRFLKSTKNPKDFAEVIAAEAHQYNGFNLILVDLPTKSMVYISNRPSIRIQEVSPGLHVLTNAELDSPWPKAERLRLKFKKLLQRYGQGELVIKDMADHLMRDTTKADDSRLPHICALEWESSLSSIFVEADTPLGLYGTRSTAALAASANGEVSFYEKYIEQEVWKDKELNCHIEKMRHMNDAVLH